MQIAMFGHMNINMIIKKQSELLKACITFADGSSGAECCNAAML